MNPQVLTLFGEEFAPQQIIAVGKSRAKKKIKEPKQEVITPEIEAPAKPPKEAVKKPAAKKAPKKRTLEKAADILNGWQPEKNYYSIGEVAGLFKVNTSHIRFWTKEFTLKVRTTKKGDRLYTPDQVRELRTIYHLVKEKGFTLAGAKSKLTEEKKGAVAEPAALKKSLLELRNQMVEVRNRLG